MNRHIKSAAVLAASFSGMLSIRRALTRSQFRIVTYHGVEELADTVVNYDRLQADPTVFTRQIEKLAGAFQIVELGDAIKRYVTQGTWPEKGLAITFDDGYRNNLEIAAPILRRIGAPATFFVTAGFVEGRTTPWWYDLRRWYAAHPESLPGKNLNELIREEARLAPMSESERESELARRGVQRGRESVFPFMSREECRRLITLGFDVQCHGDSHASFSGESAVRAAGEVEKSAEFIRSLGHQPWGLAYPYGHAPVEADAVIMAMKSHGLLAAFTTREGANDVRANPWRLNRWDLHGGYSALAALARISA